MQYLLQALQLLPALLIYRQERGSKDPIQSAIAALTAVTPVLVKILETQEQETDEKKIQNEQIQKQEKFPSRRR